MQDYKIVADSSSDVLAMPDVPFSCAPLRIITADQEFVDDTSLDVEEMVSFLSQYKGKSSTSCPNPEDWLEAFGDATSVFCVTITGTLSGSYNAAVAAKSLYEEQHPDRRVFVLNTLTAGPEIKLIIDKLARLAADEADFDAVCDRISAYTRHTGLLFMLESMKNLANNGRVSPLAAKAAGLLGIRVVGKASDKGDLQQLNKCRGQEKALQSILSNLQDLGYRGGHVAIAHCFNEEAAQRLAAMIRELFADANVAVYPCRGLCSFYAEKGGMLVGFEKG